MDQSGDNEKNRPAEEAAESLLLETVRILIEELHPGATATGHPRLDSSLDRDLGIGSLGRMELLNRLEKNFGVTIPEQVLALADTPRDLLRAIQSSGNRAKSITGAGRPISTAGASPLSSPRDAATLVEVLDSHAVRQPERVHIYFYSDEGPEETLTYGGLLEGAREVATALQESGLDSGEAVLVMLPTGREYFFSFFGVLLAGGVPVPVYPPGQPRQIEEHLKRHAAIASNCLAGLMITTPETRSFARLMKSQTPSLRRLLSIDDLRQAAARTRLLKPTPAAADTALLQYTSGSTGAPKGVILSHANLLANIRSMGFAVGADSRDVFISWLPLYHDMGLIGAWLGSLYHGCPLVLMSPLAFIARPVRWLQAIHRYRGTLSAAPNFAYELCLRRLTSGELRGLDLGSWRIAFNGAEPVSPRTAARFISHFAPAGFRAEAMTPVYGLAESSVGLTFPPPDSGLRIDRIRRTPFQETGRALPAGEREPDILEFVNCGRPLPGHQLRVVDAAGRELPDRREGNIQFQGPSATSGYIRNPDQTSILFHDGWLETGDRGYTVDGDIHVTGRSKDLIIRAGRNIHPVELEEAVGALEGIRAGGVAVFGSLDPGSGTELLVVLAESRRRHAESREKLRKAVNTVITDLTGMPPDEVLIVRPNTIRKTSSGKIRRNTCRRLYEQKRLNQPARSVRLQAIRFAIGGLRSALHRLLDTVAATAYAACSWLLFGSTAAAGWLLAAGIPHRGGRRATIRKLIRLCAGLAGIPVTIDGLANLPPPGTPCIIVSNHASYIDSLILAGWLPGRVSFVAKAELRKNPPVRFLLDRLDTEYVERFDQRRSVADTRRLLQRAAAGQTLLFFAEGTFMRMPGLLPFKMGAFEIAVKGTLPVIPLAIRGSRFILRAGSWFPRRGRITIKVGPPINAAATGGNGKGNDWARALALRAEARAWILTHCGEPDLSLAESVNVRRKGAGA